MPDILAIHWDKKRLRVVEANIGATVKVAQCFAIDIPDPPSPNWLREALRRQGVTARQAIVCLSREDAILRQLELPDAPDDELPSLVQFQASTRSTTPLDQLVLDYLPIPRRTGSVQRDVLLATVPRTSVDPIRQALSEAGLDLTTLSISSFSLAELLLRSEDRGHSLKSRLVILADGNRLEVVLLGDSQPLFAHVVRPPLDDDGRPMIAKAAADISRVLVPAQPWLVNSPIERVSILADGPEWDGLDQAVKDRWSCPVDRFTTQAASRIQDLELSRFNESMAVFAPALGLALGCLQRRSPVFDLLHPRQPRAKQDPRKLQMAVGSAAALVLLAIVTAVYQTWMASLDRAITDAKTSESTISGTLKVGEPVRKAALIVEDWKKRDINQLQQLTELHEFMGGTEKLYLTEYNFGPATGDAIGKIFANGNAKERGDSKNFEDRLVDSKRFRLRPRELTQQSRDSEYQSRFELDADIVPPDKSDKTTTGAEPAKKK